MSSQDRQASEALRKSEAFSLSVLDSVTAEIAVLDPDGVILAVNEAWRRFALENGPEPGVPAPHTGVGVNYLAVCQPGSACALNDDAVDACQTIRAVLDGRLPGCTLEYPCHSPEQERWFSMSATPLTPSGRGAVVIHTNITERKRAEEALQRARDELEQRVAKRTEELQQATEDLRVEVIERKRVEGALRETNELFSLYVRHSPIHTYIKTVTPTESRVVQASDSFQRMIGVSGGEMAGKTMAELFPADFAAKITADDWAVVAHGEVLTLDEELNGRHYTSIKFPIVQGDRTLLAGYTIDITERNQAEAEHARLEAQNRHLQKSESLGRMAKAIAHHFNNQLQVVMMNLDLAMNNLPRDAGALETLSEAMRSTRKAADISGLMLTYLGQAQGAREPLDGSDACRRSVSLLRAVMPRNVTLETDLPSPGPRISADENQIQQALTNLVTNAWEASGDGPGTVRVSAKTVSAADIPTAFRFPVDWQPDNTAYACLEVADTGCGIAARDIETLFDPFFSSKFTGRGLGLPVVLGIARAHDGAVTVESEPGRGSVFRVFFPVSAETVPERRSQKAPTRNTAGGGAVLVVEDEPSVLKVATLALERSGFAVLTARDGVEAVEVFTQHRNDIGCVLCDLSMPRMNGWETLTVLRRLAPGIPVILSSGYNEAQVMEGDYAERPQAFLRKPYLLKTLVNEVRQVLAPSTEGPLTGSPGSPG